MGDILQFAAVMGVVIGMPLTIMFVLPPLTKAIARRIEGAPPGSWGEVEALRDEVQELRAHVERIPELEERLDFAERALAAQREPERLDRGT